MKQVKIISFSHKQFDIADIGLLHIDDSKYVSKLSLLKQKFNLTEIMYLATCNRVEFLLVCADTQQISPSELLLEFAPQLSSSILTHLSHNAIQYESDDAIKHIFKVAASIDSLIVGEQEIITQVRESYEKATLHGFTSNVLRLIIKQTIACAKQIYTETNITRNPVSVVSLVYLMLKQLTINKDSKVIVIGAGVTNTNMTRFMKKMGLKKFAIFNRTLAKAQTLAKELNGEAYAIDELKNYNKGFDILLTCTASTEQIITLDLYNHLLQNDINSKIIVDLAVPNDVALGVIETKPNTYIEVKSLQPIAQQNMVKRKQELTLCKQIILQNLKEFNNLFKVRKVELAMQNVPIKVKEIRENALNNVFAKEWSELNDESKVIMNKMIDYFEKKYISIPMIMAKDILLEEIEIQQQ